jgi:hypothetical protein
MTRRRAPLEGPVLLLWAALALAVLAASAAAAQGGGEAGVRAVIRATAASSLSLLLLAFGASSLHRLAQRPASAWALRNRRWIGLSMALSHALHLGAIAVLAWRWPAAGAAIAPTTRIAGTLGTLALAALAATSSERAVAWLGARRWRALHRAGGWVLWGIFLLSYAPGATAAPGHALATAALLAVVGLRAGSRACARARNARPIPRVE